MFNIQHEVMPRQVLFCTLHDTHFSIEVGLHQKSIYSSALYTRPQLLLEGQGATEDAVPERGPCARSRSRKLKTGRHFKMQRACG